MKKIITLLIIFGMATGLIAQVKPTAVIPKAEVAPVINGEIDAVWTDVPANNIDKPFGTESPTLGPSGTTYWKALWDDQGIYVLVVVNDNLWVTGTPDWQYDKPEIYFDTNYDKKDGLGPANDGRGNGNGHYQIAPNPLSLPDLDGTPATLSNGTIWALKLNGNAYVAEYLVPWDMLIDKQGVLFDKSSEMGFDVTIIDNDVAGSGVDGRNRAVWANIGAINESWNNMDDCGIVTFDGADEAILVEEIILTPANPTISRNKGTVQIMAEVTPEDAEVKRLRWEIINKAGQEGIATIDQNGRVRAVKDGVVTIRASAIDGSNMDAELTLTLTNQKPTRWDLNHFRNGLLDEGSGTEAAGWGGWIDGTGTRRWVDGVLENNVTSVGMDGDPAQPVAWRFQTAQEPVWKPVVNNVEYEFSFTAWAPNGDRTGMKAMFEDRNNGYARIGVSNSEFTDGGPGGRSEWAFPLTTEPQRFVTDVTFDLIVTNTFQKFAFALSLETGVVMIDSILLISKDVLATVFPDDTYAMFKVDFSVEGGQGGTLAATVGDVAVNSGDEVIYRKNVVFTATPADNFSVKQWTRDGKVIPNATGNQLTIMVDEDTQITVEFQDATSVSLAEISNVRVYPNPFNNTLTIDNADGFKSVTITSIVGQRIMERTLDEINVIDVSGMKPGVYFLLFESNDGQRLVRKVVKQ